MTTKWIQKAIKKKGSLRATARREGALVHGRISRTWLEKKAKGKGITARRARLAITLSKLRRKKK